MIFPYDLAASEGPNRVLQNLILCWVKSGHSVTVLTGVKQKEKIPNVRYRYVKINRFIYEHILRFFIWWPKSGRELSEYDAILDAGHTIPLFLYQRLFGGRAAFFQSHQNLYLYDIFSSHSTISRIRSFCLDYFTIKLAKKVIAVSEMHKGSLVSLYGNGSKISVIQNGVSISEYKRTATRRTKTVLFIGNLKAHLESKGIPTLLKAFSMLARKSPDCRLVLAGKPNPKLDSMCRELGIYERTHYAGFIKHEKLIGYYNMAKVLVLPSVMESDALVVKEAMATGTPVIVSNGVGSSDAVREAKAGMVFPVSDYRALYSCLDIIMSDDRLALELGNNGRLYAEAKLSWDKIAQDYLDLFGGATIPRPRQPMPIVQRVRIKNRVGFVGRYLPRIRTTLERVSGP